MSLDFKHSNVLSILEDHLTTQDTQDNILDKKAQDNINSISIILAIVVAFKLASPNSAPHTPFFLGGIFLIYLVIMILSFYIIQYPKWESPLDSQSSVIQRALRLNESDYYNWITDIYIKSIEKNKSTLRLKSNIIRWTIILIGVDILLIVIAAAIA